MPVDRSVWVVVRRGLREDVNTYYAAYRGRTTEEAMMRFNDVIYALPALPFLIILAVTISNSIFVMIGFLMIFGWVGVAKISRSTLRARFFICCYVRISDCRKV